MTRFGVCVVFFFCLLTQSSRAAGPVPLLKSPDGHIVFRFLVKKTRPGYSVAYQGQEILAFSPLLLVFDGYSLSVEVKLLGFEQKDSVEQYRLLTGRSSAVRDSFRRLTIR